MPYIRTMSTEQSTYKNHISDKVEPTKLNEGKPRIMNELKRASIKVGGKVQDYTSEFKS